MPGFLIRPATPADVPAITAIYAHYVLTHTATFELDPPDETEMAVRMGGVHASNLPYLVAQPENSGSKPVGYAYAHLFHARPGYRFTIEDSVYIDPAFTGRGIGTLLLGALLDRCRATGARQMIAAIGGDNPASIKLHAAHGFQHAGVLRNVGLKFDRWLDVTYMQLAPMKREPGTDFRLSSIASDVGLPIVSKLSLCWPAIGCRISLAF